jgi:prepilin-type N-terminal cleavage/methylation domain-containing protein
MRKRAFTLIEVLVAMGIIAVLVSLLMAALPRLRAQASTTVTAARIEAVHGALAQLSGSVDSLAFHAQQHLSEIGGTLRFIAGTPWPAGTPWHRVWPDGATADRASPLVVAFPLGKRRKLIIAEAWYADPQDLPLPSNQQLTRQDRLSWERPEFHGLTSLRTHRSEDLLRLAEVIPPGLSADRDPDAPWNDVWGMPLVVGYALYQPPAYNAAADRLALDAARDRYLQLAREHYGYTRSLTVAVASGGRSGPGEIPDADPEAIWTLANELCNRGTDGRELWRVDAELNAFEAPPWQGVRTGGGSTGLRGRPLLSAPVEYR